MVVGTVLPQPLTHEAIPHDDHLMTVKDARTVARFFQVLADPTRVRILSALAEGKWCVTDLTAALGMDQPAISHQLRYLREMEIVTWTKDGRHVYYTLADDHIKEILLSSIAHLQCAS